MTQGISIFENSPGSFSVQLSLRTSRLPVLFGGVLSLQFNSFYSYLQRDFYCSLKEKMTLLGPSFLQRRYQPFIREKKELKNTISPFRYIIFSHANGCFCICIDWKIKEVKMYTVWFVGKYQNIRTCLIGFHTSYGYSYSNVH